MTKKFWKNWKERVYDTDSIYLFWVHNYKDKEVRHVSRCPILSDGEKILNASFHNDAVDLVIERRSPTMYGVHIQNEYLTLHRKDIARIKFKKRYNNEC